MSNIHPFRYQSITVLWFVCLLGLPLTAQVNRQDQVTVKWDLRHDLSSPLRDLAKRAHLATGEQKRQEVETLNAFRFHPVWRLCWKIRFGSVLNFR